MTIVTKTGDDGTTALFGGQRVEKHSGRMEAIGTVDELNAALGIVIAEHSVSSEPEKCLVRLQHLLFMVGADLATPMGKANAVRMTEAHVKELEDWVKHVEDVLPPLQWFILPGGTKAGAYLHLARTICRRAERRVTAIQRTEPVNEQVMIFLNRLSDLLFLLARMANRERMQEETRVQYDA